MERDIYNFHEQLQEEFEIENEENWKKHNNYVLSGMGGSHLQGDILKAVLPDFPIIIHSNYGLPLLSPKKFSLIAASYSGNTEEVLHSVQEAAQREVPTIIISKGGELIDKAKEDGISFINLPQNNIQPRLAIGYSFKALLKALSLEDLEEECSSLATKISEKRDFLKKEGEKMVSVIEEKIPIIYASNNNDILARIFKINFNETTKIPSFYNSLPELNHNEMTGFDVKPINKHLSGGMSFIFLRDKDDNERIKKRFDVLKSLFETRGLQVLEVDIIGETRLEKMFSTVILSAWASYYLSFHYKTEPSAVPMVEEFKDLIK